MSDEPPATKPVDHVNDLLRVVATAIDASPIDCMSLGFVVAELAAALCEVEDTEWRPEDLTCAILDHVAERHGIAPMDLLSRVNKRAVAHLAERGDPEAKSALARVRQLNGKAIAKPHRTVHVGRRFVRRP